MEFIIWISIVVIGIFIIYLIFKSPFHYPYFEHYFDVSGKRNPDIRDLIDNYLIQQAIFKIKLHEKYIEDWKKECQLKIKNSKMKKYRMQQYKDALDDAGAYRFYLTRMQTRYVQRNYIRSSYKVEQVVDSFDCSYKFLIDRDQKLKNINYECTLKEYNSKNQRKLMTKELRQQVIKRDNYTCQNCGKYMPDEVGLHVDHIIPISKGGKTVISNLQVLCSKCNGSKSNK